VREPAQLAGGRGCERRQARRPGRRGGEIAPPRGGAGTNEGSPDQSLFSGVRRRHLASRRGRGDIRRSELIPRWMTAIDPDCRKGKAAKVGDLFGLLEYVGPEMAVELGEAWPFRPASYPGTLEATELRAGDMRPQTPPHERHRRRRPSPGSRNGPTRSMRRHEGLFSRPDQGPTRDGVHRRGRGTFAGPLWRRVIDRNSRTFAQTAVSRHPDRNTSDDMIGARRIVDLAEHLWAHPVDGPALPRSISHKTGIGTTPAEIPIATIVSTLSDWLKPAKGGSPGRLLQLHSPLCFFSGCTSPTTVGLRAGIRLR